MLIGIYKQLQYVMGKFYKTYLDMQTSMLELT